MLTSEFRNEIYDLAFKAEVNQLYYQIKHTQMWWADKGVKIGVAVLATLALVAVFFPHDLKWLEVVIASLAAAAALVLNVVPVGEWMCEYREAFRVWNSLLTEAEHLRAKVRDAEDSKAVPQLLAEMIGELATKQNELDDAHAPNIDLLDRCQGDVVQRMYGKGVRTYEQAVAEHQKRVAAQ